MTPKVGTVLAGKYRLDRELGRGGMGAVYRAFHLGVHKEYAVKVLLAEVAEHRTIAQRFKLEAQAAGRIGHPGILDVHDIGEDDGTTFIVMELLRGEPLASLLKRSGRLDPETACWITVRMLEILGAAHKAGVVHRDVKPQNVFLCEAPPEVRPQAGRHPDGASGGTRTIKLLDFGIAKFAANPDASAITRSGEIIGSPLYMAPEQAKGEMDVDARVDVWSVGAMLFEMLTGKAAHAAPTPVAVLAKILMEPAPPPSGQNDAIPSDLDIVVQRALAIDRETRFTSAQDMLDALEAVRAKLGWKDASPVFAPIVRGPDSDDERGLTGAVTSTIQAPSKPTGPPEKEPSLEAAVTNNREQEAPKQRPWAMIAVAVLGALVLVPFLVSGWGKSTPPPPPTPASSAAPTASVSASSTVEPVASVTPIVSASASATVSAIPTAAAAAPIVPRCKAGEVLSSGHCCPRGLEWQAGVGRCERPLATSF